MKKEAFKGLIDDKIKKVIMIDLNIEKEKRFKIRNLEYKELKTQEYLLSKINIRRKKLILLHSIQHLRRNREKKIIRKILYRSTPKLH